MHDALKPTSRSRRDFVRHVAAAVGGLPIMGATFDPFHSITSIPAMHPDQAFDFEPNMIGPYGPWVAERLDRQLPSLSFRNDAWSDVESWRRTALERTVDRMLIPDLGSMPEVTVHNQYTYDGLHIEELSWQLPYGRPTQAVLLKPVHAEGPLPGILGLHDHGGNKYFGLRKITRTQGEQHPMMVEHQERYYSGRAWANELARMGYLVLVPDAFAFASRRVWLQDVPERIRQGLNDDQPEHPDSIEAYNLWASDHESILAKSLFCGGTTWPGMFFAEDQKALDILCARPDVDADRVGCCGLSGGGLRTVMMGGLDERIACAVCVGFMSTWKDFLLNKSHTHTWMLYVPTLPLELDFPEILSLRIPRATLVLNDEDDSLYTLPEMQQADAVLRAVYEKAGAGDRYRCSFYPGGHKFDHDMQVEAFDWFDTWLKA